MSATGKQVLTKAALRAAESLGLTGADLAPVLGVSPSKLTRCKQGQAVIDPNKKEFEAAALFVRLYRSLDALLGGDESNMRKWLSSHNDHLQGIPIELIVTVQGLLRVNRYLDAMRGKV